MKTLVAIAMCYNQFIKDRLRMYRMVQMFDGRNFEEFDESKLHRQNFSSQYFAVE